MTLPIRQTDDLNAVAGQKLLVGLASDKLVQVLVGQIELQLDERYPGDARYRIKRLPDRQLIAIAAVDEAGLARGVRNWLAFLRATGHWLCWER